MASEFINSLYMRLKFTKGCQNWVASLFQIILTAIIKANQYKTSGLLL